MTRGPAGGLLHPAALLAAATLAANDHLLKTAFPSWWTGKLSDVAGLVLAPLVLVALVELWAAARGRWRGPSARVLGVAVAATAVGFAAVKLLPVAGEAYRVLLGALQAPFRGRFAPVALTRDPTDLLALPALLLAWWAGRQRGAATRRAAGALAAASALALCAATSAPAKDLKWNVFGFTAGPPLMLLAAGVPERFTIVFTIPIAALPPDRVGTFGGNVSGQITADANGTNLVPVTIDAQLTQPLGPHGTTTLKQLNAGAGVIFPDIPLDQLTCDASACTVRVDASFTLTSPTSTGSVNVTWGTSAIVLGEITMDKATPPPGTAIGVAIMAVD